MTSYHNHTLFSDGAAGIDDMVRAAAAAGLCEAGISDHIVLHPAGRSFRWAMPVERLEQYAAAVRRAGEGAPIPVRLGIEADYFPETAEATRLLLARQPFDYLIGSVHFAGDFLVDESRRSWAELDAEGREAKWREYWEAVTSLAQSRIFDLVAHFDIPKRFGFRMLQELPDAARRALDAVAEAGMAMELNTSGWDHPAKEPYPSPALLTAARARGIPILINADAHSPKDIARKFPQARRMALDAGYTQVVRYAGRRRSPCSL